jgi:predicted RNA-binding protein associated with RNAse of E/G family
MKQKQANRPNWGRIIEKRYYQEYVKDGFFEGYLTFLLLDKVAEPLTVKYGRHEICIVDHGYSWLMFFPKNQLYSLTVMINHKYEILQWYFDMIQSMELSPEGIPLINDMYLDLVYLPNGKLVVKDINELHTALMDGSITREGYDLISQEGIKLQESIKNQNNILINQSQQYIEKLKTIREHFQGRQ